MGDLQALLTDRDVAIAACPINAEHLAAMICLIEDGTISGRIGKDLLPELCDTGKDPKVLVEEKGLVQISDTGALEEMARDIIAANPGPADDFRGGNEKAIGFLVGQMMKASKGKANPKLANEILRQELTKEG